MASVVVETDTYDATVTVPDDGDAKNAASVTAAGVGFQPLSNRTSFLNTRKRLAYPDGAVAGSGGGNFSVGTPPTMANIEVLTVPAGLRAYSTAGSLRLTLANLVVGDILHISGTCGIGTSVGPARAMFIGDATNDVVFPGWMYDITGGGMTEELAWSLTYVVGAAQAPGFDIALGVEGIAATGVTTRSPGNLCVVAYRA